MRPLGGDEAVSLFVERARAVQPSFVADDATREICRRLDGIPLALEMAAARLRSMQPPEILARLDERFRLLVGGRRAVGRQQTLRATVAWSHDLLDDRERRVFRRLSVFAGSFALDAAEAVTADDDLDVIDVDDLLGSLVAKSLVVADAADGATRYSLLETIRQFAQEQLDAVGRGRRTSPPPRRALRPLRRRSGAGSAGGRRTGLGRPRRRRARQPASGPRLGARRRGRQARARTVRPAPDAEP